MPHDITHFAVDADDLPRAQRFHERAFGWRFEQWAPRLVPDQDRPDPEAGGPRVAATSVDRAKPAIHLHFKTGHRDWPRRVGIYSAASAGCKPARCSRIRQLRGPHLRTRAWWSARSSSAVTAAVSPRSFPQSSTGRFEVISVLARS
jgi:Glyoxalase-like domain